MGNSDDHAAFYRAHPYPKVDRVESDSLLRDHLRYLAGACHLRGPTTGKVLVAGCGTREAVTWALSLPDHHIHAFDLSQRSIDIAARLATQLGVRDRITFTCGDFTRLPLGGPFDFISSYGVLHHLPDPPAGLAALQAVLAPGGLMALMVYNRSNRGPIEEAQRVLGLLAGDTSQADFEAIGTHAAETLKDGRHRLAHVFRQECATRVQDPQHFADTLLNPRERCYTLPELVDFLGDAGLALRAPVMPVAWDCFGLLDAALHGRFEALPLLERLEVADLLQAPLFWVVAGRADELAERACVGDRSLFWDLVVRPLAAETWPVQQLRVSAQSIPARAQVEPVSDTHVQISRHPRYPRPFHRIAGHLVRGLDGRRTLRQVADAACAAEDVPFEMVAETLEQVLRTLIGDHRLGTPDFDRCARCPARRG